MIHKLKNEFNWYDEITKDLAKQVLDFIEKCGMIPPLHPIKGYQVVEENPTGTKTYYRKRFNEWEDE